ncbi:TOMM precursor leader peptide-binding protein [Streptomyces sp. NPDC048483]|uniref:TOMM precursor leader peptide-binding protein n=1 Tax=Streptomyces sp. NPDC048483 TaxID=3154927 RepID=UPI003440AE35
MTSPMTVALVGEGSLADAVGQALRTGTPQHEVVNIASLPGTSLPRSDLTDLTDLTDLVVVATDGWDTRSYDAVRAACTGRAVPWLPVRTEYDTVIIGPLERPGEQACVRCAEIRRDRARDHAEGHRAVRERHAEALAVRSSPLLTPLACEVAAALVADEADSARDGGSGRTHGALLRIPLDTLAVSAHRFLPDPWCGVCGRLPDDSAERGTLGFVPRPKPAPGTYRLGEVDLDALAETYVDGEAGLIRALRTGSDGGVATAVAPLGVRGSQAPENGFGRSRNYRTSRTTAVLEALERYGGGLPGGVRTAVRAAYREIADRALDPRTLGLHPKAHYRRPDFRLRPFTPDTPYDWVWGYSFRRQGPVLVPESCAYYRTRYRSPDPGFVYEISNGCALGASLEEAVLHGILEVAERDAFLLTWYAQMPVPRLDLATARDPQVPLLAEVIAAETGYQVMAFDTTLEEGVPSVWAMAVDTAQRPGHPRAICAAGAHLDPERAVANALAELGPMIVSSIARQGVERDRAALMARDPWQVTEMAHHELLYGHPDVFDRFDFLLASDEHRAFADCFPGARIRNDDLTDDLAELAGRFVSSGLDVVVVDQTTPEHAVGGYRCVKTLIPGTLSMTFGHAYRRVHGLRRLLEVPHRLGYRAGPLRPDEINPHPHPFP